MVSYHNVYFYSPGTLWLAYGIAILFSSISATVGIVAVYSNGLSYSNDFSTVLRVSRHADMTVEIHSSDIDGSDPLPRYLAKCNIAFPPKEDEANEDDHSIPLIESIGVRPKESRGSSL